MRALIRTLKLIFRAFLLAVVGLGIWLYVAPPDLIRVASGYSAKMVCSNVFLAGRDPEQVLELDVQAPGHPILRFIRVSVDRETKTVSAGLLGVFGKGLAVARDGTGCATVPDGNLDAAKAFAAAPLPEVGQVDALWPEGGRVEASQDAAVAQILDDPVLAGPGMRAMVVVQNGRIVGERYGEGFSQTTPLLGWSMTKTVNAAIIGTLVKAGQIDLAGAGLFEPWKADGRAAIKFENLMSMTSGLEFNEEYGDVTDVTRMLYLEPDMAGFASAKPLVMQTGTSFNYSSGSSAMLSRLWQNAVGDPQKALALPREALFGPLGMASAVMETDARGTFVGSSYMYATAQDWARFGQFLLQDGVWNGAEILPAGYAAWMREQAPGISEKYGRGQVWLRGPSAGTPEGQDPDAGFDLPPDAYWALGHDGQTLTVIPSKQLVVLRMGLTPSKLGYKPQALVSALAKALPDPVAPTPPPVAEPAPETPPTAEPPAPPPAEVQPAPEAPTETEPAPQQ